MKKDYLEVGRQGDPLQIRDTLLALDQGKEPRGHEPMHFPAWEMVMGCLSACQEGRFEGLKAFLDTLKETKTLKTAAGLTNTSETMFIYSNALESAAATGRDILPLIKDMAAAQDTEQRRHHFQELLRTSMQFDRLRTTAAVIGAAEGSPEEYFGSYLRNGVEEAFYTTDSPDKKERLMRVLYKAGVDFAKVAPPAVSMHEQFMQYGKQFALEAKVERLEREVATLSPAARSRRYNAF